MREKERVKIATTSSSLQKERRHDARTSQMGAGALIKTFFVMALGAALGRRR